MSNLLDALERTGLIADHHGEHASADFEGALYG
jgi:hypothetical protein